MVKAVGKSFAKLILSSLLYRPVQESASVIFTEIPVRYVSRKACLVALEEIFAFTFSVFNLVIKCVHN